ncbi:MAG: hypothetical protein U1E73_10215 [Planctomycetota bacterium]
MRILTLAAITLFTSAAFAQTAGPGISWDGTSTNSAGSFLPTCQVLPVTMVAGETVTITVWGDILSPFGLFASTAATQSLQIPGLGGCLALDPPAFTVAFGVLTLVTPCLSCPPGLQPLTFQLPANLPPGTVLAVQGAALGSGSPAFTSAIRAQS